MKTRLSAKLKMLWSVEADSHVGAMKAYVAKCCGPHYRIVLITGKEFDGRVFGIQNADRNHDDTVRLYFVERSETNLNNFLIHDVAPN